MERENYSIRKILYKGNGFQSERNLFGREINDSQQYDEKPEVIDKVELTGHLFTKEIPPTREKRLF